MALIEQRKHREADESLSKIHLFLIQTDRVSRIIASGFSSAAALHTALSLRTSPGQDPVNPGKTVDPRRDIMCLVSPLPGASASMTVNCGLFLPLIEVSVLVQLRTGATLESVFWG